MIKGKLWSFVIDKLSDLNLEAKDKVIKVKRLDESILIKAEVIGVKGIVCLEKECDVESEIPIKKINKDEWDKIR